MLFICGADSYADRDPRERDLIIFIIIQARMNYKEFLSIKNQFSLGGLLTEQSHPHTVGLSDLAVNDLPCAINRLRDLDISVMDVLLKALPQVAEMHRQVREVQQQGNRIFICGCGSTGRLALTLETLYRQVRKRDDVVSFMAGGDVAIIASVEDFEDHPEFGSQQLLELGFREGDLLIASTEGGETPWVIGATQEASKISRPFFLYCNPDEVLTVERSQQIFKNERIRKINLTVGNQGITGSTRMQCSTILTYAIGLAILLEDSFMDRAIESITKTKQFLQEFAAQEFLAKFIVAESDIYKSKGYIFYRSLPNIAIGILTDTTERSPTFSLYPFEGIDDQPMNPGLCYFVLDGEIKDSAEAWRTFFYGRDPRALDGDYWAKYQHKVSLAKVLSHDISPQQIQRRKNYAPGEHFEFRISQSDTMRWEIRAPAGDLLHEDQFKNMDDVLGQNIVLKSLLNIHSTLLMGRLGRFQSNIMIYVRPSNFKLIDRAIRYVLYLLEQKGYPKEKISYERACEVLFEEKERLVYGEAIVLKVFDRIIRE